MNSKKLFVMPISAILLFAVFSMIIPDTMQNAEASGDKKKYRDNDRYYNDRQYQEYEYEKDRYNGDYKKDRYNGDYKKGDRHSKVFVAELDGDSQVPPNNSPAQGLAFVKIIKNPTSGEKELWYSVDVLGIPEGDDVTAIHLHAIENEDGSGPHVATLCGAPLFEIGCPEGPGNVVAGSLRDGVHPEGDIEPHGDIQSLRDLIKALKKGELYVNVHGSDFDGEGEIRGVLHPIS